MSAQADVMHLMTLEMGAWCGATQDGPGIFRASSQWREVTCPACTAKGMEWLRALVWDMLATMGPSREALSFAVRAGRLGVTDEDGRPLAMACAPEGAVFGPYAAGAHPEQATGGRYRKRPVEVEAVRWTGDNLDEMFEFAGCDKFDYLNEQDRANCDDPEATATVFDKLHSTWVLVKDGQWIIKGIRGEFYPCADDVFAETYEQVTG